MAKTTRSDENFPSSLNHEKNKYQAVFNHLRSPAAVLDQHGCIDTVNPAWTALFDDAATPGMQAGQPLLCDGPAAWLAPVIDRFIKSRAHHTTDEQSLQTSQGTRHMAIHIHRINDDQTGFSGCTVILEDITSEKVAAAAACDSERLQGALALAGAVCHDLNQPLMAISGYAELLLMNSPQDAPYFDKLKKIADQVKKVGDITRKLMNVTRYETKAYLDRQIIDIEKSSERTATG